MGAVFGVVLAACAAPHVADAAPTISPDALIVGLDQVRQIAGNLDLQPDPDGVRSHPASIDPDAPGECWAVSNEESVFGAGWAQFAATANGAHISITPGGAKGFATVTQAIGAYPDAAAARAAFDRLAPALTSCAGQHVDYYEFSVTPEDPSTLTLHYPDRFPATVIYRVKDDVLTRVSALALPDNDRIAHGVLTAITDRIG